MVIIVTSCHQSQMYVINANDRLGSVEATLSIL